MYAETALRGALLPPRSGVFQEWRGAGQWWFPSSMFDSF